MDYKEPKKEDIEELVSFLPILYNGDAELYNIEFDDSFYHYNDNVYSFIELSSKACWVVSKYSDELIKNNGIENASLEDIKSLLTFCIRGEKFYNGHIARMLEKKIIKKILDRLNVILKDYH